MNKTFFTSDLHFGHNRKFLYGPRGFNTITEHDKAIIKNWNLVVGENDIVYVLGDLMLNNTEYGLNCLNQLNGHIVVIRGNHDTDNRVEAYDSHPKVIAVVDAYRLKYGKCLFYLSHFPTLTGNLENEHLSQMTLNLFGHTHSKEKFFEDRPYMYNVALDANDNTPVEINEIIAAMKAKVQECKELL